MYSIKFSILIGLFTSFLPIVLSKQDCSTSDGFKTDAQFEFEVKHVVKKRGMKELVKVNEAEIIWNPQEMLDIPLCYDLSKAELQYSLKTNVVSTNAEDDDESIINWLPIKPKFKKDFGKKIKWIVKVVPCFKYHFRVGVNKIENDASERIYSGRKSLPAANESTILDSKYTPEVPAFINYTSSENSATLAWTGSHCVTSYDFFVKEEGDETQEGGEYRNLISTNATIALTTNNLKPCTNYEATLQAILGKEYSDDQLKSFSTKPNVNTSENIRLKSFEKGINYVSFSLSSPWSPGLVCLKQFRIQVCSKSACKEPSKIYERTPNNPTLETRIDGLRPCTQYKLKITPLFDNVGIQTKIFPFETLPPGGDLESYIPKAPTKLSPKSQEHDQYIIEWDESECVDHYQFSFEEEEGSGDSDDSNDEYDPEKGGSASLMSKTITSKTITLSDLNSCSRYQSRLSTIYKGKQSPHPLSQSFEVYPTIDAGQVILNIIEQDMEDKGEHVYNRIYWDILDANHQCMSEYQISLCKIQGDEHDEDCEPPKTHKITSYQQQNFSIEFEQLKYCTKYMLKIQPVYPQVSIDSVVYHFKTGPPSANSLSVEGVDAKSYSNGTTVVSWDPVLCAMEYRLYQNETEIDTTSETHLILNPEQVASCSKQNYFVMAVLEDMNTTASDPIPMASIVTKWNVANTYTPPNLVIRESETVIDFEWSRLPCIDKYQIQICLEDNECKTDDVSSSNEELIYFNKKGLEPCSHYTFRIIPIFSDFVIKVTEHKFKTLTPKANTLSVSGVQANSYSNGNTVIIWDDVECVSNYVVHQNGDEATYDAGAETQLIIESIAPCSVKNYSVIAVLDSGERTSVNDESTTSTITRWHIDESYDPSSYALWDLDTSGSTVDVTWIKLPCIQDFEVILCPADDTSDPICLKKLTASPEENSLHLREDDLSPCTDYNITISPIFLEDTEKISVVSHTFKTLTNHLDPPRKIDGSFKMLADMDAAIYLDWASAECATGYKISKSIDGVTSENFETDKLQYKEPKIERCTSYVYSISSSAGDLSSESKTIEVITPPNNDVLPNWDISKNGKTVEIDFNIPPENSKCSIQGFEIGHNASGKELLITFDSEQTVIIDLSEAKYYDTIEISGRILYNKNLKDISETPYLTEVILLEEPTTTTTTTTTTTKPPTIQSPTHSKAATLASLSSLNLAPFILLLIKYLYNYS